MKKRILLVLLGLIILSSVVSAGFLDFLTGKQVQGQSQGLIYMIGPSVPQYSVPFNIVVVTNKLAVCQYALGSGGYTNFINNGVTDHIESITWNDGNILFKARCKEIGWFKPWEYTQTNFIVSTKGGCCIVGNECNNYKSIDECMVLGGALYPDPNCNYVNCQGAPIAVEIKKPDLVIENIKQETKTVSLRGGEEVRFNYKVSIKNIGNAPVNDNFYLCAKPQDVDYCTKGLQVQQRGKEYIYEGAGFISNLIRSIGKLVGEKEVLDPINVGQVKEVTIVDNDKLLIFAVDVSIDKSGKGSEKICVEYKGEKEAQELETNIKKELYPENPQQQKITLLVNNNLYSLSRDDSIVVNDKTITFVNIDAGNYVSLSIKNDDGSYEKVYTQPGLTKNIGDLIIKVESFSGYVQPTKEQITKGESIITSKLGECELWIEHNYNNLIDESNENNNEYIL